jgi:hypothetical protein
MSLSVRLASVAPGVLLVVLLVMVLAISVGGLLLVRRVVDPKFLKLHNEIAGFVFAAIGAIYAVLLAFATVQVWDAMGEAESRAAAEDGVAFSLYGHLRNYPDGAEARPALAQFDVYVRSVLEREYAAMARGEDDVATEEQFQSLWMAAGRLTPESPAEQVAYAQISSLLGDLSSHRRVRLEAADGEVPAPLWHALLIGGFLTIAFTWIFGAESFSLQLAINVTLAVVITLLLYVTILLNHPFAGSVRVEPEGYRDLAALMAKAPVAETAR